MASLSLAGRWNYDGPARVQARLVREDDNQPVTTALDWQDASTQTGKKAGTGTWRCTLKRIPAGGLYRLETRCNFKGNPAGEWSPRGDMRHFLGVGDLWIIAGQSNAAGYGRGPVYDPPTLGVHILANNMQWGLAAQPLNESTDTLHPVNRELANPAHSPYLHFARLLQARLHHPIGLIQTSLGGSPLAAWNPNENPEAGLFHSMVTCVQHAGGKARGVVWYQGESDCAPELAVTYKKRFIAAVKSWRKALGQPRLPVITTQLNRVYGPETDNAQRGWTMLREAQRQVPTALPDVMVVPALDFSLTDAIHTGPDSNLLLATRLANAALGGVHGQDVLWLAPDAMTARLVQRTVVEVAFRNVAGRLGTINTQAVPFVVEDANGKVEITQVEYRRNTVRLSLAQAPQGRAVVHGAFGTNPPIVPMDMERMMPMLGFYGLVVEGQSTQAAKA